MKFYQQFDYDESLTFDQKEITQCIDFFAQDMGKERMKKILEEANINFHKSFGGAFADQKQNDLVFDAGIYQTVFENLSNLGQDFVHF